MAFFGSFGLIARWGNSWSIDFFKAVARRHGDGEGGTLHLDGVVGVGRALPGVLGEVVAGGLQLAVLVQLGVHLAAVVRRARGGRPGEWPRRLRAVGQALSCNVLFHLIIAN